MSPAQKKIAGHFAAILAIVYEEDRKDDNMPEPHDHVIDVDTFWSVLNDHYGPMRDAKRLAWLEKKSPERIRDEIIARVLSPETWDKYRARYLERVASIRKQRG